ERTVRGVDGVGAERLHPVEALVGVEHLPVRHAPRHGRVVAHDGAYTLHRRVGPVHHDGARVDQLPPHVRTLLAPARPQFRLHPRTVRSRVYTLHGRDHAEGSEARDVVRMQVLGVLDAPARVTPRGPLVRVLEDIEGLAVPAVADGVDVQLV